MNCACNVTVTRTGGWIVVRLPSGAVLVIVDLAVILVRVVVERVVLQHDVRLSLRLRHGHVGRLGRVDRQVRRHRARTVVVVVAIVRLVIVVAPRVALTRPRLQSVTRRTCISHVSIDCLYGNRDRIMEQLSYWARASLTYLARTLCLASWLNTV